LTDRREFLGHPRCVIPDNLTGNAALEMLIETATDDELRRCDTAESESHKQSAKIPNVHDGRALHKT